jgi:hypothetical protein
MKKYIIGLSLLIALTTLAACSASPKGTQNTLGEDGPAKYTVPATTTWAAAKPSITASIPAGGNGYSSDAQAPVDRMVVRTGTLQLVVSDVTGSLDQVARIGVDNGGYVVSSQKSKNGERLTGFISIRVLAVNYDKAVLALRALALDVVNETSSSQDVTQEYVDLTSRLKNLQATDAQLLKIMAAAVTTKDVLDVQNQLTDIEGQIEQTKGRMQYLEQTSSTSLINVQLDQAAVNVKITADKTRVGYGEKVHFQAAVSGGTAPYSYEWTFGDGGTSNLATPDHSYSAGGNYTVELVVTDDKGYSNTETRSGYINVEGGWNAGAVVRSAWNGLSAFGRVLLNVVIWLGIFSPLWIVILIVLWFSVWRKKKKV